MDATARVPLLSGLGVQGREERASPPRSARGQQEGRVDAIQRLSVAIGATSISVTMMSDRSSSASTLSERSVSPQGNESSVSPWEDEEDVDAAASSSQVSSLPRWPDDFSKEFTDGVLRFVREFAKTSQSLQQHAKEEGGDIKTKYDSCLTDLFAIVKKRYDVGTEDVKKISDRLKQILLISLYHLVVVQDQFCSSIETMQNCEDDQTHPEEFERIWQAKKDAFIRVAKETLEMSDMEVEVVCNLLKFK